MEMPSVILQNLVCDNCEGYLSRGPVLLLPDGKSRCGRCVEPEEGEATRNRPYEQLAKFVIFPCRYRDNGCEQQVSFAENQAHEDGCAYRDHLCPIAESGKCEWTGVRGQLLEHCQQMHPENVVENPVELSHDITKPSLQNYLLSAFQVLFLVQTKVCVTARTIYHSVRLIGDPSVASKYEYELNIQNNGSNILKRMDVAPPGCLALQVDSSIAMSINIFLGVVGNFQGTTFTVTVREKDINEAELGITVQCVKCDCTTEPVYQGIRGWLCRTCAPNKILCRNSNRGCTYKEIEVKCLKHEQFCNFENWCIICSERIKDKRISIKTHYRYIHSDIVHKIGTKWMAVRKYNQWRIILTDFGPTLCYYNFHGYKLFLFIRTQLPTEKLYKYRCVIEITNPQNGKTWKWTANRQYFYAWDWELNHQDIINASFTYGNKLACGIKINFFKVENLAQLNTSHVENNVIIERPYFM